MPKTQDIIERELDHPDSHPSSMQPFLDLLESEEGEAALIPRAIMRDSFGIPFSSRL